MKLVLIGIQGSGKSTQGNILSQSLAVPYISTGEILRDIAKSKGSESIFIRDTLNAGHLLPDDLTIKIVQRRLSSPKYNRGYILDGFPRTLYQAQNFKEVIDFAVYINLPDEIALNRIAKRKSEDREDDTHDAITNRIAAFHKNTNPILDYYRQNNKLISVDGSQTINKVQNDILSELKKS